METKYKWTDPATGQETAQGVGTPTPITPTAPAPISSPQTPQPPQGSVAIDGAKFNTKETQQANFSNIQPIGNTLYGIPKAPVVPDIMSQKDLGNAMSPQALAEAEAKANSLVGFSEQQVADLNKANLRVIQGTASETDIKNLNYARSKGWQATESKDEIKPTSSQYIGEPAPTKSTTDQIFEMMWNAGALRQQAKAEAAKDQNLMAKGEGVATAETFVNKLRTEIQNKQIYDIKDQDVIRAKPILTSQIQGQLNELSREQKLDAMILQNNYNNALVELQIAQGNYDRAREIVNETANDVFETSMLQIEALQFRNQIENVEADRLRQNLEYERDLSLNGYVHIKSPEELKGLKESDIFRDPVSGKIYMKPEPTISRIMEVNGRQVGLDDKGNVVRDFGAVSVGGGGGSSTPITPVGPDEIKFTPTEQKNLNDVASVAPAILDMSAQTQLTVLRNLTNNIDRANFVNDFVSKNTSTGTPGQEQSTRFVEPTLNDIAEYRTDKTSGGSVDNTSLVAEFLNKPKTTEEKTSWWNNVLNFFKK